MTRKLGLITQLRENLKKSQFFCGFEFLIRIKNSNPSKKKNFKFKSLLENHVFCCII